MRAVVLACALVLSVPVAAQERKKADPQVQRGRYLMKIAGCHDCHTANYAPSTCACTSGSSRKTNG